MCDENSLLLLFYYVELCVKASKPECLVCNMTEKVIANNFNSCPISTSCSFFLSVLSICLISPYRFQGSLLYIVTTKDFPHTS